MPVITIALDHVTRIDTGTSPVVSPMLGSTSIYPERNIASSLVMSPVASPLSSTNEHLPLNLIFENDKPDNRKLRFSTVSLSPTSSVHKVDFSLLDGPKSPDNSSVQSFPTPIVATQSFSADWSKLNKDESRNLLICVLFVLKHLDNG